MDMGLEANGTISVHTEAKKVNKTNPNVNAGKTKDTSDKTIDKLIRWFLFSVIGSIIPLVATVIGKMLDTTNDYGFFDSICKGELLLISISINCAILGELFGVSNVKWKRAKIVSGALGFLLYILQATIYTIFTFINTKNLNKVLIERLSIVFFVCTLALSISNLILGEVE